MMKTQSKVLVSILLCLVLIFPAAVSAAEPANPLVMAQQQVEREFARMDAALKKAAQKLGIVGLTGEPARAVLRELAWQAALAQPAAPFQHCTQRVKWPRSRRLPGV